MRLALAPLLSLVSLVACSRLPVATPDAAADASPTPMSPEAMPDAALDATTIDGGDSAAPVPCFGHRLEWTSVGGLTGAHDEHSITGCRTSRVKLTPELNDPVRSPRKSCTSELPVTGPAPTLDDLGLAISDPVVAEAFARGGMIGQSMTRGDGSDLVVTLDGKRLTFGRGLPAPLQRFTRMLIDIGGREVMRCRQR